MLNHRNRQGIERQFAGEKWTDWSLVFTTLRGTPIEPSNLTRNFKSLKKRAGLPAKLRFHDLRHTRASLLIAQGVHPREIMNILGHSQIALTMDTYGHLFESMHEETAAKMDAILTPAVQVPALDPTKPVN